MARFMMLLLALVGSASAFAPIAQPKAFKTITFNDEVRATHALIHFPNANPRIWKGQALVWLTALAPPRAPLPDC